MPRYWNAHSDRDWEDATHTFDEPEDAIRAKVVTYGAPSGGSINLTLLQIAMFKRAGLWPRSPRGDEYCQVSHGLHVGHPTFSDNEVVVLISKLTA